MHPDSIHEFLTKNGFIYTSEAFKGRSDFKTSVTLKNAQYQVSIHMDTRRHFFAVYAHAPLIVSETLHADLLKLIAEANWGQEIARFELNPKSGEFRCAATAYLPDSHLSMTMVKGMMDFTLEWLDAFFPALVELERTSIPSGKY